jgi:hypothetical protein
VLTIAGKGRCKPRIATQRLGGIRDRVVVVVLVQMPATVCSSLKDKMPCLKAKGEEWEFLVMLVVIRRQLHHSRHLCHTVSPYRKFLQ